MSGEPFAEPHEGDPVTSYLEQVLASQDLRFQAALAKAGTLYHAGTRGAQFEERVLAIIRDFLPGSYRARDALLAPGGDIEKQLDLVVHPGSIPPLFEQLLPIELITVAGEIKTNLKDKNDIRSTAKKLADAAATSPRQHPVPFFVLAGTLDYKDHGKWLAELVAFVSDDSLSWPLWLAVFSFDKDYPMSAMRVSASSPIRALTTGGEVLDGVVTISGQQLSPSAMCYLWIWAAIYAADADHGMDFRYMRDEVERLCAKEGGLEVQFRPEGDTGKMMARHVSLLLPEGRTIDSSHAPVDEVAAPASDGTPAVEYADRAETSNGRRKVMLITLGPWVDEPDSWDESAWGGSPTATRRGYGYYSGMTHEDLLNSCRLFWRFNPESGTWRGIEYAVVAHDGRTRAVVGISRYIGPFWGRHGFRGHVVTDPALVQGLVGREVPRRQNPITTIEL
jgi:hypothetical protein